MRLRDFGRGIPCQGADTSAALRAHVSILALKGTCCTFWGTAHFWAIAHAKGRSAVEGNSGDETQPID